MLSNQAKMHKKKEYIVQNIPQARLDLLLGDVKVSSSQDNRIAINPKPLNPKP